MGLAGGDGSGTPLAMGGAISAGNSDQIVRHYGGNASLCYLYKTLTLTLDNKETLLVTAS